MGAWAHGMGWRLVTVAMIASSGAIQRIFGPLVSTRVSMAVVIFPKPCSLRRLRLSSIGLGVRCLPLAPEFELKPLYGGRFSRRMAVGFE